MNKSVNISIDYKDKHELKSKLKMIYGELILNDQHSFSGNGVFFVMIPDIPERIYPNGPIPSKMNHEDI